MVGSGGLNCHWESDTWHPKANKSKEEKKEKKRRKEKKKTGHHMWDCINANDVPSLSIGI
jgi:hypothetical protein